MIGLPRVQATKWPVRTLAFGSISASYAAVMTVTTQYSGNIRILTLQNTTDAELTFSLDAGTTDHYVVPANSTFIFDLAANGVTFAPATISVKGTPTSGNARVSVVTDA